MADKKNTWLKAVMILISLSAVIYCTALLAFDVRLDYEARKAWCGRDKACQMKLWLEYKIK